MFIKSLFAAALAAIGFSAFGFDQPAYDATYTTNGITYAQRGGLGVKDFVVTNIDASAVGKVKSVNGRVGDVVLDAAAVNALPDDKDELVSNDNFKAAVATVSPPVELPAKWALANVTNANGKSVRASDVGALGNSGSQTLNQSYNGLSVTFDAEGALYTGQYAPSKWSITKEVNDQYYYVQFFGFNGTNYPSFNLFDGESDFYIRLPRKEGTLALQSDVESKADRPALPVAAGNLAALTADGNLADSGKMASDFLPAKDLGGDAYEVSANTTFKQLYGDALVIDPNNHWFWGARFFYDPSGSEAIYDDANEIAVKGDIPKSFATASITNANGNAIDDDGKLTYGKIRDRNGYETHGIHAKNSANEVYITTDGLSTVDDSGYSPYQGLCVKNSSSGWSDYSVDSIHFCPKGDGQLYYYNFPHDSGYIALEGWSSLSRTLYTSEATALATHPTFSNAVLAVGLNIDTNSVAVLNEISATFGGFPIEGTATTVGGLLATLAATIAWLKKNKVGSFASVGGATATVENGVAKLDDFFTNSNSLLTGTIEARLPYPLYAVPSTGILKDRAINTTSLASVTVPDNFTDLLIRASVASSLSVTMPAAIATKYGDTFPAEAGEYLITITKTGVAEAYVRTIKLEVANA